MENLKLVYDIINSEGPILQLYKGRSNTLYLASLIKGVNGFVVYSTTRDLLVSYAIGSITLNDLYIKSPDFLIKHRYKRDEYTCVKKEFEGKLELGNYYNNKLNKSMCHGKFSKAFQG